MSQREVAEAAGVHLSTVSKIERGLTVQIDVMRMVAQVVYLHEVWMPSYVPVQVRRQRGLDTPRATGLDRDR